MKQFAGINGKNTEPNDTAMPVENFFRTVQILLDYYYVKSIVGFHESLTHPYDENVFMHSTLEGGTWADPYESLTPMRRMQRNACWNCEPNQYLLRHFDIEDALLVIINAIGADNFHQLKKMHDEAILTEESFKALLFPVTNTVNAPIMTRM